MVGYSLVDRDVSDMCARIQGDQARALDDGEGIRKSDLKQAAHTVSGICNIFGIAPIDRCRQTELHRSMDRSAPIDRSTDGIAPIDQSTDGNCMFACMDRPTELKRPTRRHHWTDSPTGRHQANPPTILIINILIVQI